MRENLLFEENPGTDLRPTVRRCSVSLSVESGAGRED